MTQADPVATVILGAAGRDFHNFNMLYRNDPRTAVVAFTATQIPGIAGRRYPASLAGPRYPDGIPIRDEAELEVICREHRVGRVMFAYSDVPHAHVMHLASRALAVGADFLLAGPARPLSGDDLVHVALPFAARRRTGARRGRCRCREGRLRGGPSAVVAPAGSMAWRGGGVLGRARHP